jgi:hypothetical protein
MKSHFAPLLSAAIGLLASLFVNQSVAQPNSATVLPGKSYQILNKQYGELLRPEGASNANGTPIVLHPGQPWKCMTWKLASADESRFFLQNHFTSKTLGADSKTDASIILVRQVPFGTKSGERPSWRFTKLKDSSFKIEDAKTGKALTAQKSLADSRITVLLQDWAELDAQKWELHEMDPAKLTM